MKSGERRFIAGPQWNPYNPKWSPAGQWIAAASFGEAEQDDAIILISPDRTEIASSPGCPLIDEFAWAPSGKQLAYVCSDPSARETDFLWVWDVEK